MLRTLSIFIACVSMAAGQPTSWIPRIASANMLYTSDDSKISSNNMPMIGNGFLATQLMSQDLYLANIYNGYLTTSPSHRARVPATNAVAAPGITSDAALDIEYATFYRRSYVDPSPGCTVNSTITCTNANGRIWVEQRWYAHRMLPSVMVMEVEILPVDTATLDYATNRHLAATQDAPMDASLPYAMVKLVNNGGLPSSDILFWPVETSGKPYSIINGSTYVAESNTSGLQGVCVLTTNFPPNGMLAVSAANVTYAFLTVVRTTVETNWNDLVDAVESDWTVAQQLLANGTLHSTHVLEWQETVWSSGYEIDRFDVAQVANSSLYAIVSSIRNDRIDGICPSGLTAGYNGHKFWDQETWMFPAAANTLHPDLAASLLLYRFQRLAGAHEKALSYSPPYSGAMFPWESALTGLETCPTWAATGLREIHINGDISMAVWMYWRSIQDNGNAWLSSTGYPILSGIADFWISKLVIDNPNAAIAGTTNSQGCGTCMLSLNDVIPPDEYHDHVNNSVFTNVGARYGLTYATEAAKLLGYPASTYEAWLNASTRITIPFNASWPGIQGGLHPEYDGYFNDTVKQADVILLGFPVHLSTFGNNSETVRRNDLDWYAKVTDPGGPAMTWGMFAAGYLALGDVTGANAYFNQSFANAQPPFKVWTETPTGGTPNFLTGAGGFLQVPILAYTQIVMNDTALSFNPVLPQNSHRAALRGMSYRGQRLNIAYTNTTVTVSLQQPTEKPELNAKQTHSYAYEKITTRVADERISLLPIHPIQKRSQRGQVMIDGYQIKQAQLYLIEQNGAKHVLSSTPVVVPVQQLTVMSST